MEGERDGGREGWREGGVEGGRGGWVLRCLSRTRYVMEGERDGGREGWMGTQMFEHNKVHDEG